MDVWEKRRRNLRALLAHKGLNATQVAKLAEVAPNSVGKFLRGDNKTMNGDTLERVLAAADIPSVSVLDADNPFSDAKAQLFKLIDDMSEAEAEQELKRLKG